jgi:hypothetical protein
VTNIRLRSGRSHANNGTRSTSAGRTTGSGAYVYSGACVYGTHSTESSDVREDLTLPTIATIAARWYRDAGCSSRARAAAARRVVAEVIAAARVPQVGRQRNAPASSVCCMHDEALEHALGGLQPTLKVWHVALAPAGGLVHHAEADRQRTVRIVSKVKGTG